MKKPIEQFETEFQEAFAAVDNYGIWKSINICCENILKKLLTGFPKRDDFDELVDEATTKCFNCLNNHLKKDPAFKVEKLVNFCWLTTYYTLKNPKRAFFDNTVSYEEMMEKLGNEATVDNGPEAEMEKKEEAANKQEWIEMLKYKMAEALTVGYSELQLSPYFDIGDVESMTIFDVKKDGNTLKLNRRF